MNTKPSEVHVSLNFSDWKNIIVYLKNIANQPYYAKWVDWIESVTDNINISVTPGIDDQAEVSVVLKPSEWNGILALLKPTNKNDSKEYKEFLMHQISIALNFARYSMIVTTGDIRQNYAIVGPVYFQVSNKGVFSNQLVQLSNEYRTEITEMRSSGQIGESKMDWGFLYGEMSVGQSLFEQAFYVAVQELKKRTMLLNADGVIAMRQDIDLDTTGFQYFYLQMYGTAVRFLD